MTQKAIDISAWQGTVSVGNFQKTGIKPIILRSSYTTWEGFNLRKDKVFEANVKAAYKAGRSVGIYHYSQAISVSEAIKEAECVIKTIKPYKPYITLPVFIDWEFGGRLSSHKAKALGKETCGKIVKAFCSKIKDAGYKTGVYANLSTLNAYLPSDLYKACQIWVAQYHSRCDYKHPYIMWQYSSSGSVKGISGRIDMNWWYDEAEPVAKKSYMGSLPKLPHRGWFTSGDRGEEVKKLQKFLNWYGDYGLAVDAIVGRKTIEAVRRYQGREKLRIDGCFGRESLKRAGTVRR